MNAEGPSSGTRPVGRIVGSHGLKGWVKVAPMTEFLSRFQPGSSLLLDGQKLEVLDFRVHKSQIRLRLEGVSNRNEADRLRGRTLEVPEEDRPMLDENEFLPSQIVGLNAITQEGKPLGQVDEVIPGPAHDLLRLGNELVPMVSNFVREIDLEEGRIVIQPIEGMFENEA